MATGSNGVGDLNETSERSQKELQLSLSSTGSFDSFVIIQDSDIADSTYRNDFCPCFEMSVDVDEGNVNKAGSLQPDRNDQDQCDQMSVEGDEDRTTGSLHTRPNPEQGPSVTMIEQTETFNTGQTLLRSPSVTMSGQTGSLDTRPTQKQGPSVTMSGQIGELDTGPTLQQGPSVTTSGQIGALDTGPSQQQGLSVTMSGQTGSLDTGPTLQQGPSVTMSGQTGSLDTGPTQKQGPSVTMSGQIGELDTGPTLQQGPSVTTSGQIGALDTGPSQQQGPSVTMSGQTGSLDTGPTLQQGPSVTTSGQIGTLDTGQTLQQGPSVTMSGQTEPLNTRQSLEQGPSDTMSEQTGSLNTRPTLQQGPAAAISRLTEPFDTELTPQGSSVAMKGQSELNEYRSEDDSNKMLMSEKVKAVHGHEPVKHEGDRKYDIQYPPERTGSHSIAQHGTNLPESESSVTDKIPSEFSKLLTSERKKSVENEKTNTPTREGFVQQTQAENVDIERNATATQTDPVKQEEAQRRALLQREHCEPENWISSRNQQQELVDNEPLKKELDSTTSDAMIGMHKRDVDLRSKPDLAADGIKDGDRSSMSEGLGVDGGACGGAVEGNMEKEGSDTCDIKVHIDSNFWSIQKNLQFLCRHKVGDIVSEHTTTYFLSDNNKICLRLVLSNWEMTKKLKEDVDLIGVKMDIIERDDFFLMIIKHPMPASDFNRWVIRCFEVILNTLKNVTVHKLKVEQDFQMKFVDIACREIVEIFEKEVLLFQSQLKCCVWVAGSEEFVGRIVPKLNSIKTSLLHKTVQYKLERIHLEVFKQEDIFSKLGQKFPNIKYKIQDDLSEILIEGHGRSVQPFVNELDGIKLQIMEGRVNVSAQVLRLLQTTEVQKQFDTSMKNKNICCVWCLKRDESVLAIHACGQKMLKDAVEHFDSFFVQKSVTLDSDKIREVKQSAKWQSELQDLHKIHINTFLFAVNKDTVTVTGMVDAVNDCLERWNKATQVLYHGSKTTCVKTLVLEREVLTYINQCQQDELREISEQRNVSVQQTKNSGKVGFLLKGKEEQVKMVEEYVRTLTDNVASRRHHIDDEDQDQVVFFRSTKGKALLNEVEATCKCCIQLERQKVDGADTDIGRSVRTSERNLKKSIVVEMSECKDVTADAIINVVENPGGTRQEEDKSVLQISIVKGELAKQSVDCLVNTTHQTLNLNNGAVSISLLRVAGREMQDECFKKYPNGIKLGELAVTQGYRLKCKFVYHGALDAWNTYEMQQLLKTMNRFIKSCLHEANNHKLKSIAFPALGSGKLNYPITAVAQEMFNAVEEYQRHYPQSTVTDIFFVVFPANKDIMKAFETEKKKRSEKQSEAKSKFPGQAKRVDTLLTPDARLKYSIGNIDVVVEKGDISQATEDGVVILWDEKNLYKDHILLQKAGEDAKRDWNSKRLRLRTFVAISTVSGDLQCSQLIHALVQHGSIKSAVGDALRKARSEALKSLAFSLSADDMFGADKWASSVFNAILSFMRFPFKSSLGYIRLVIEDIAQLSVVISTLSQKTGTSPQQLTAGMEPHLTAVGGKETATKSNPTAIGAQALTITETVGIGAQAPTITETVGIGAQAPTVCFLITGPTNALQRAVDYLEDGYDKARKEVLNDLSNLSSDRSTSSIPLKKNLGKTGKEDEDTKKSLFRSLSANSSSSLPTDIPTVKMSTNDDMLNVSKNIPAQNETPTVAKQSKPVFERSQQEQCCVVLTDYEKMDKNKLSSELTKHIRKGAEVVDPFQTSGQILFVFPTPQDAVRCMVEFKGLKCTALQLDPQIVVNVKEEINPGLVKMAQSRGEWQDLIEQIQSKSAVCIKESSEHKTVLMEGSKLQIEEAECCLVEYVRKLGISHQKLSRANYKSQDFDNCDQICEIQNVFDEMYQKFIDLFTDKLQNFKASNIKLKYRKQDNMLLIIAPKSEIDAAETTVRSKLAELSGRSNDEIFISEDEAKKVNKVLDGIVDIQDGVHFKYDSTKKVVVIVGREWQAIRSVKHQILIGLGRIRETGRCNRRFQEPCDASSKTNLAETRQTFNKFVPKSQFPPQGCKKFTSEKLTVYVYCGNILELPVDCIVNAANETLQHGGGIAQVIANAAGPKFEMESKDYVNKNGLLTVGTACMTSAGKLPYRCVIHTVGPQWNNYKLNAKGDCLNDLWKSCMASLLEAEKHKMNSIAIPAISAGMYGVPKDMCAGQYAKVVKAFSKTTNQNSYLKEIHFMDKDIGMVLIMQNAFEQLFNGGDILSVSGRRMDKGDPVPSSVGDMPQKSKQQHSILTCSQSAGPDTDTPRKEKSSFDNSRPDDKMTDNEKKYLNIVASQPDFDYPKIKITKCKNGKSYDVFKLGENFEVHVYSGNIVDFDGAAVVCSEATEQWKLGHVASEIFSKAGNSYKKDKREKMKQIERCIGDVVVTTSGSLKCSKVIHVIVPVWEIYEQSRFIEAISKCFKKVLDEASRSAIGTLAMPLFGAGKTNSPIEQCANAFLDAVLGFSQRPQKLPHLREIHIVDKNDKIPAVVAKNFKDHVQAERDRLMSDWMREEMKYQGISVKDIPS